MNQDPTLFFIFFILLLFSFYNVKTKPFIEWNFWLIIFSLLQGMVIGLIFPKQLLISGYWAIFYFLFFTKIIGVLALALANKEKYSDNELEGELQKLNMSKNLNFRLMKYSGKKSLNAFMVARIPIIEKQHKIYLGDDLISSLNLDEKVAVIAHEFGHILNKDTVKKALSFFGIIFSLILLSLLSNISNLKQGIPLEYTVFIFYVIIISIFFTGIILINYSSWYFEYEADEQVFHITGKVEPFVSAFKKFKDASNTKEYGKIVNLILYDHPPIDKRIERLEKYPKSE